MLLSEELKKSVLMQAIQGKLSYQNKEKEQAASLFQAIDEKRKILIREGQVKNKKLEVITEEEYPFEIPDNWLFVRLNNIYNFIDYRGKTPKKLTKGIRLIGATNIKKGYLDFSEEDKYISEEEFESRKSRGLTQEGDLLFVTEGGTMGNISLNSVKEECSCGQRVITFQSYLENSVVNELYMYFIMSDYFQNLLYNKKTGSAATGIKGDTLKTLIVPLPPYEEQLKLLKQIKKIFKEIECYEVDELNLKKIKDELPIKLEASIYFAGIKGKLTNQNEEDTSVDELILEAISERKKLIKDKIIRNEKISTITEEEFLFDIPDNWRFEKLGNIIKLLSGQDFSAEEYNNKKEGVPYLTGASNIDGDKIIENRWTTSPKTIANKGDILLSCKGTVGKVAILNFEKAHIARQFMSIRPLGSINRDYVYYFLKYYVYYLKAKAKSMIPGIERKTILESIIPVPPMEEQQRIVDKIKELVSMCQCLETE